MYIRPQYLVFFLEVSDHDDGRAVVLPHHPPEVGEGGGDGSLRGDVGIGAVVALGRERR